MPTENPHNKVLEEAVRLASKEDLTLMLYDGAIKFCNQAVTAIEKSDAQKAHALIIRAQDIVREFQLTLERKNEIAKDFDALYAYIHRRLVDANFSKDVKIINEVLSLLRELRDTWKEAMRLARKK
ncbi:MAG: flagellar export chaperone FliS [Clostridiales bacterium]|jgi:flagellar protein FliS|nr:flagellar export chaperone FliS [Clostridiales bacterium]